MKKCPHCGKDIPDDYDEEEEEPIMIVTENHANRLMLLRKS